MKADLLDAWFCPHCHNEAPSINHAVLGLMMRSLRHFYKLSLRQLAERVGISANHLSDLECGQRHWHYDTARRVLDAMSEEVET